MTRWPDDPITRSPDDPMDHAATLTYQITIKDKGDGAPICLVLLLQDSRCQGFFSILVPHLNHALQHDRAGIDSLIDHVDRAARDLYAIVQRLSLRMESWERGQQRRMDV